MGVWRQGDVRGEPCVGSGQPAVPVSRPLGFPPVSRLTLKVAVVPAGLLTRHRCAVGRVSSPTAFIPLANPPLSIRCRLGARFIAPAVRSLTTYDDATADSRSPFARPRQAASRLKPGNACGVLLGVPGGTLPLSAARRPHGLFEVAARWKSGLRPPFRVPTWDTDGPFGARRHRSRVGLSSPMPVAWSWLLSTAPAVTPVAWRDPNGGVV